MAAGERLTARQRNILKAVVSSYVETGEPVGSGTVARLSAEHAGISSATVRNEMAALTASGLLEQPHTSAGRIPTARAFRLYVDELTGGSRIAAARLPAESQRQIDTRLAGIEGTAALLEQTTHLLAALSSGVGIAIASAGSGDLLEHVHFSRLGTARILAVVVTRSGLVRDRMLALDRDFTSSELETAANFLNERFRGWTVERIRAELGRLVDQERNEYQRLLHSIEQLWLQAAPERSAHAVYVGGVGNLVLGSGSEQDRERLREILAALEAKQRVFELLSAYIDARHQAVRVVFDMEQQAPEMAGLVLIAAPARVGGDQHGTVGVIGTTRIDYEMTMNAVSYIAETFERILYRAE